MAQWSQGLLPGSMEQVFSFSKKSTSSETAASATPNLSSLGCVAGTYIPLSQGERVGGAS